jgi:hypothetical protein
MLRFESQYNCVIYLGFHSCEQRDDEHVCLKHVSKL